MFELLNPYLSWFCIPWVTAAWLSICGESCIKQGGAQNKVITKWTIKAEIWKRGWVAHLMCQKIHQHCELFICLICLPLKYLTVFFIQTDRGIVHRLWCAVTHWIASSCLKQRVCLTVSQWQTKNTMMILINDSWNIHGTDLLQRGSCFCLKFKHTDVSCNVIQWKSSESQNVFTVIFHMLPQA